MRRYIKNIGFRIYVGPGVVGTPASTGQEDGRLLAIGPFYYRWRQEWAQYDRDGSNLRRLTHSPRIDTNPSWSPTGRELAFTSSRSGKPHIYLMDAEGANLRRTSFDGDYNDGADWNPEGTHLVYASRRQGRFQLALTDLVTLETKVLTSGRDSHETPSFSPDGRKIAFSSNLNGRPQIHVLDRRSGDIVRLTSQGRNWAPSWIAACSSSRRIWIAPCGINGQTCCACPTIAGTLN